MIAELPPLALSGSPGQVVVAILALLVFASLTARLLRFTLARRQPHAVIDNLVSRINAWWVIALVVGLALAAGRDGVTLLFAAASLRALGEFFPPPPVDSGLRKLRIGGFLIVVTLQYGFVWNGSLVAYGVFIPLLAAFALPLAKLCASDARLWPTGMRDLRLGLLFCVWGISHVPALFALPGQPADGHAWLVVFLLLVVQLSDVLQYVWGKLAGRHAIAPRISPGKTVEGTIGGLLSASAVGAAISGVTRFTPGEAAIVALLLAILGFLGGLTLSAIKRQRGVKDWGSLIPGHGGMLDRLDSLCLSAPAFHYLLCSSLLA
ncbi:phosphatidate cytidylyltransferase [Accumulibacter sp.]|uniref:phosphatidate cytidylyltransferase n=1 Tax=Accumulibacter sp. TaxID=2053492 RepID=UPI0025FBEF7D|nr:phosphatidate cytidylyltransferase [Accumulibacter sp.]MCM8594340.1 phosphatidate cytidylyltransferase [Accumulibacter sp.]MCM8625025.1 phosphatidate cytidylyltransferase [Accumulibacter sp.]MDS4048484.1 phosphatidate cytidylyltransferase [Accumulibacter sp.]